MDFNGLLSACRAQANAEADAADQASARAGVLTEGIVPRMLEGWYDVERNRMCEIVASVKAEGQVRVAR